MKYSIYGWNGAPCVDGAIDRKRVTMANVGALIEGLDPQASFDLTFELTARKWLILTCNEGRFVVTIQPAIYGHEWFIHCVDSRPGTVRFVTAGQTEVEVPCGAVMERELALEVVVEAVANGGSMNDVDRWTELATSRP